MRYGLLETIREYGLEQLEASGETATTRSTGTPSTSWPWLERIDADLWGPNQACLSDRCEAEHDNFRAALTWTQGDGDDPRTGLRLSAGLIQFWTIRGHLGDIAWLETALAARLPVPPRRPVDANPRDRALLAGQRDPASA